MKICTVVGARPQFIKAAALSRVLRKEHQEVLIHTGQHYDRNMSGVFFDELAIPLPAYNLGIAGGSHGKMTGEMLIAIESVLQKEKPDMVLVYGDTNSTLAGALAASKLHIPICHVEAGVRMGTLNNPEEINRVITDRISTLLMCCTNTAVTNLSREGITSGVHITGDLMYDAVVFYEKQMTGAPREDILDCDGNELTIPTGYYLLTCHREENTGDDQPLTSIFRAMQELDCPVIYPVHPRNSERAKRLKHSGQYSNIILAQPVGYISSLYLIKNSVKVVTDSGGLQREAWFLNKQCITLLDYAPWPETLDGNINQLCKPIENEILQKLMIKPDFSKKVNQFGDGFAGEKIVSAINSSRGL